MRLGQDSRQCVEGCRGLAGLGAHSFFIFTKGTALVGWRDRTALRRFPWPRVLGREWSAGAKDDRHFAMSVRLHWDRICFWSRLETCAGDAFLEERRLADTPGEPIV